MEPLKCVTCNEELQSGEPHCKECSSTMNCQESKCVCSGCSKEISLAEAKCDFCLAEAS